MRQIIVFKVDTLHYCLDIGQVTEIINLSEFTHVPETPDFIEGILNLRGKVLSVINLRKKFSLTDTKIDNHSKIIVLNQPSMNVGILVDKVTEIIKIEPSDFDKDREALAVVGHDMVYAKVKTEKNEAFLLELDKLLKSEENLAMA